MRESETLWLVAKTVEALKEALKTALISQLVLIPWLSSLGEGHQTLSNSTSPEDSTVWPQPEVGRLAVAEARM